MKPADLKPNEELAALISGRPVRHVSGTGDRPPRKHAQWRLVLPMVNEAARLLAEGVTDSTDAVDLATVFGTGLAPFRGGLARSAERPAPTSSSLRWRAGPGPAMRPRLDAAVAAAFGGRPSVIGGSNEYQSADRPAAAECQRGRQVTMEMRRS